MQEKIIITPWGEIGNEYLSARFFDPKFPLVMVSPSVSEKMTRDDDFGNVIDFSLIYQYLLRTAEHFRNKEFSAILLEKHYKCIRLNESDIYSRNMKDFRLLKDELDEIYVQEYRKIPNRRFFFSVIDPMFDLKNPIIRVLIIAETDTETLQSQIFSDVRSFSVSLPRYESDRINRLRSFTLFPYESLTKTNDSDMLKKILFFMIRSRPFRFGHIALSYPRSTPSCLWSEFAKCYYPFGERDIEFEESLAPYVDINKNWPDDKSSDYFTSLSAVSAFEVNYEEV